MIDTVHAWCQMLLVTGLKSVCSCRMHTLRYCQAYIPIHIKNPGLGHKTFLSHYLD
jgi:hypothetical protein